MKAAIPIKGVKLITDETENRRYVQIDLITLAKEPEAVEEYLDGLVALSRRNEPSIPHEEVMKAVYKRAKRKRATPSSGSGAPGKRSTRYRQEPLSASLRRSDGWRMTRGLPGARS